MVYLSIGLLFMPSADPQKAIKHSAGDRFAVARYFFDVKIFHDTHHSWIKTYTFVSRRVRFVCASKCDPYSQGKGAVQHIKSMMRVLEILSITLSLNFCDVGLIFALCLIKFTHQTQGIPHGRI